MSTNVRTAVVLMAGLALLIAGPVVAQKAAPAAPAGDALEIAPLLTADVLGVVRVDVASIDLDAAVKPLDAAAVKAGQAKVSADENFAEAKKHLATLKKSGGKVMYVLLDESATGGDEPVMALTLAPKANAAALAELFEAELVKANKLGDADDDKVAVEFKGMLLVGPKDAVVRATKAKPVARPDIAKAMAASNGAPITVAFVLPKAKRQEFTAMLPPELPEEIGGGSTACLGKVEWVTIAVALPPKMALNFTINCENAAAAKELKGLIDSVMAAAEEMVGSLPPPISTVAELLMSTLKGFNLQAKGTTVAGGLNDKQISDIFVKAWALYAEFGGGGGCDEDDDD